MASYFTQFSEIIPLTTEDERAWWAELLAVAHLVREEGDDPQHPADWWRDHLGQPRNTEDDIEEIAHDLDEYVELQPPDNEGGLPQVWLHSFEGSVERIVEVVQAFLAKFRPTSNVVMSWASTCSKPRPGAFDGGAVVIMATRFYWIDARTLAVAHALGL